MRRPTISKYCRGSAFAEWIIFLATLSSFLSLLAYLCGALHRGHLLYMTEVKQRKTLIESDSKGRVPGATIAVEKNVDD